MDLVLAAVFQIRQILQNSLRRNGNGAKWNQLADRVKAETHPFCRFLDAKHGII
jgi:hypothetical protein